MMLSLRGIRHYAKQYYTLDNIVLLVALLIAFSWVWGTMDTLQNNYHLQSQVDALRQEVEQSRLETDTLGLENQYFASSEYLELQARERLGKAAPGEGMLILPPSTVTDTPEKKVSILDSKTSNFQAWLSFFFANRK